MFCKFCGNLIDDDSVFCPKCGKNVQVNQPVQPDQSAVPLPEQSIQPDSQQSVPQEPPARKNNTLKIILIILSILLILGLAAIGGCLFLVKEVVSSAIAPNNAVTEVAKDLTTPTFTTKLPDNVTLEMVRVPNCSENGFIMGDSGPYGSVQHKVYLSKDFYLGKYEVTQAQWQAVMGTDIHQQKAKRDSEGEITGIGRNYPMEFVNYEEALDFCAKLTARGREEGWLPEKWKFTLPTEAQWEYACRAGTSTYFSYGNAADADSSKMNYNGNSTVEVGSLGYKNAFGLYDMHGNVYEWCLDSTADPVVTDTYIDGIRDPLCTSGSLRIVRGGGYLAGIRMSGSHSNASFPPAVRSACLGFRVALVQVD